MAYPAHRLRRLRATPALRRLVRETRLHCDELIAPLFVQPGRARRQPIAALPGHAQLSADLAAEEARRLADAGVMAVLLFGVPDTKDARASGAYAARGVVQRAVAEIKRRVPGTVVITDVCLCAFMDHGHCGVVVGGAAGGRGHRASAARVDNDATLALLAKTAVSHARAGADVVAPSDMMDGRVGAIREALDAAGFADTPIMSYAAKYASAFYGPFREAAGSAPQFGDRTSYQMDPANVEEALREVALDVAEGADVVLVKPAVHYLDVIRRVKARFGCPVAAYHVSGEYAMIAAAAERGWVDERAALLESTMAIKRAGADCIVTYGAKQLAAYLNAPR